MSNSEKKQRSVLNLLKRYQKSYRLGISEMKQNYIKQQTTLILGQIRFLDEEELPEIIYFEDGEIKREKGILFSLHYNKYILLSGKRGIKMLGYEHYRHEGPPEEFELTPNIIDIIIGELEKYESSPITLTK